MLVLDGSPGAGKSTLLGRLLESLPEKLIVFPEAQPSPALTDDAQVVRALLVEDRARIDSAARLHALNPGLVVASDRCHIGVLAYRYALVETGRAPRQVFDHALATVDEFHLGEGHRFDTVRILRLEPAQSVHRRAAHAHDGRYQLWYNPVFLAAYNNFLDQLRLYTSSIHRRHLDNTIHCLHGAQEITADWLAAHAHRLERNGDGPSAQRRRDHPSTPHRVGHPTHR